MDGVFLERLRAEGIKLDARAAERLERFVALLTEWNGTHNLTGARTVEAIWDNIVDALYPLTFVDRPGSLLDVGTGAGFPGLVLAIAWPDMPVVLAEPLGKRAAFLKYAAMELELEHVTVARMRVEQLVHAPFELITSRAVTDTKLLLDLTKKVADSHTQYLFYKGSRASEELAALETQPNYVIVQHAKRNYVWIK
jgi:16S rRNA (guanine527-N7)-methyltransferase